MHWGSMLNGGMGKDNLLVSVPAFAAVVSTRARSDPMEEVQEGLTDK